MKLALLHLKWPAMISSALVLPFIILELVNRHSYRDGFPIPLFGILWLLPMAFTLLLIPLVRTIRARYRTISGLARLLLGVALLLLIAGLWVGIARDQMPCFLGVPLCD